MNSLLIRIRLTLLCVMLVAGGATARSAVASILICAQSSGAVVTGTVTDQKGAVVVNAEVQLLNLASGRQLKTNSDSSGKYEFTGLPSGPYQLSVNSEGFAVSARSISLRPQFYNRSDTAVALRGSANNAPLSSITPLRTINGVRFDSLKGRWFGEYEIRYQARVERADPLDLSAAVSTEFGTFRSLNSFAVQSVRGGLRDEGNG